MGEREGYEVLRLIEHNQKCYISSDYVEGKSLIQWLKYHPNLTKKQLFLWIRDLADQLECIHKCRGNPCYQYVNPYSVIVTEDMTLHFLDMSVESNEKMLVQMNRRSVRENFLPPEVNYYQAASIELDIYGLGRTIQYLLSVTDPIPELTRRETVKFQKIISRCLDGHSKRAFKQMFEIQKEIPNVTLRTSLIVGFPGENQKDFDELCEFVRMAKFDKLGAFTYSKEDGTPASRLKEQIHPMTKKSRYNKIMKLQQEISKENEKKNIGRELEILIEGITPDKKYYVGRSYMDVPDIDGVAYVKNTSNEDLIGKYVKAKVVDVKDYDLILVEK